MSNPSPLGHTETMPPDPVAQSLSTLSVHLLALRVTTSEMDDEPTEVALAGAIDAFNTLATLIAPEAELDIEV